MTEINQTAGSMITLPNGAVKQNRRVLLDDLTGRRYEYLFSTGQVLSMTNYRACGGIQFLSVRAAVTNCIQRLTTEWRSI